MPVEVDFAPAPVRPRPASVVAPPYALAPGHARDLNFNLASLHERGRLRELESLLLAVADDQVLAAADAVEHERNRRTAE